MAFGKKIRELRDEASITAEQLADYIGIKVERLRKWEQKDTTPKKDMEQIELFFNLTLGEVMQLSSIRKYVASYNMPEVGQNIAKARASKRWSQEDVVKKLIFSLKHPYVLSQYKKLEAGIFLKTKAKIVIELDKILNTTVYEDVYNNKTEEHDAPYFLNDNIFYVPVIAQSEYVTRLNDPDYIQQLKRRAWLLEVLGNSNRHRIFDMKDDSMLPLYKEGAHLLCEKIAVDQLLQVGDFYVYVVVLDTGITIKRLRLLKDQGKFVAKSDNTYYHQYLIPVEDVKEIWLIKGEIKISLKKTSPEPFESTIQA
jgi:transcriptional regulator with XRE-family HTH domain